ncbi:MAG: Glu-tRNA(Gln) amidotransferase subunit GatD [Candidatus Nanoarchaeia archaeon]|nr:Glu-tRNA(Gln) amidotransferase subunit GatD [Candidatus Nanoarchaeia archaeon]MDD5358014.1 Glu-tRNA(Gln) amidotransferase subunit GatD [Candidatus Nanoarchaeia archaeon]MDD5588933.1 Glu-tRNA(Gln) amidotransferase subunit GatD [Candidatus Nanoarchaeia archaeon]
MEKTTAKPGDYVEIHLTKLIYEGVLLESPETEKSFVLLKLDSGYNMGFNRKDILKIVLLKKAIEGEKEKVEIKKNNEKKNIAMIITGGTIASVLDPKTGGVHSLQKPEDLFQFYPELFEKVNIVKVEIPFMKMSEDMDFKDWQKIAKVAVDLLNDNNIQGIIITHGTDTLHYTSAALSFFIRNLNKPVVLTYSQRSIDRASSDADLNLQCSALAAISDIAEVMLVGHASSNDDFCNAMPGTKVRKLHTSRRDAFKVVNDKPFAKIYPNKIDRISEWKIRNKNKAKTDSKFEEKIALVKIYPGQNPDILDYYAKKGYKGIVLELTGLGHAPTKRARNSWTLKLKEIQKKGIVVCAASQCIFGRVDPLVYSNGREILATGVIYLEDMLAETALVKLGWVLGHEDWKKNKKIVVEKMLENIAGEINKRLEE